MKYYWLLPNGTFRFLKLTFSWAYHNPNQPATKVNLQELSKKEKTLFHLPLVRRGTSLILCAA
jgi:hypothetical protein